MIERLSRTVDAALLRLMGQHTSAPEPPHALVLAYHGVVTDGGRARGERALHVPFSRFLQHCRVLSEEARVVPLEQVLSGRDDESRTPWVAITFDDAYVGAVELALPELARRGWPSTMFVPNQLLGTPVFWWDALADMHGGSIPATARNHAIDDLAGDIMAIKREWPALDSIVLPPEYACSDEQRLVRTAEETGVTLAMHTGSHINVATVDQVRLELELSSSYAWCNSVPGGRPWLAYPFGRWSREAARTASRAGVQAAFRVDGGWSHAAARSADPMTVARFCVGAGLTPERLRRILRGRKLPLS